MDMPPPEPAVRQVEKQDFTALVPAEGGPRQPMDGFEPVYTDIVDYIVRSTHRIWDEKNPGLIYNHYASNAVVYGSLGTSHTREEVVRATIQRIAEFPERRGMAEQVIWSGNDKDGFYSSHLVSSTGRHLGPGTFGKPTGRTVFSRTIADCMVHQNRVYREWLVRDNMAVVRCLGLDPDEIATRMAAEQASRGVTSHPVFEGARVVGQYPPDMEIDTTIAGSDDEAALLRSLHRIYNLRMFGTIRDSYAPTVLWHGAGNRDLYGIPAVTGQVIGLFAMLPDASWTPHHTCSVASVEGGVKIAVRWTMEGTHSGHGVLGAPTGRPLFVMGMSHFHLRNGRVVEEWMIYDELALRIQLKLPE